MIEFSEFTHNIDIKNKWAVIQEVRMKLKVVDVYEPEKYLES